MYRSLLTGLCFCVMAAALPAVASAQTTAPAAAVAVTSTASGGDAAAAAAVEAVAPTAGADVAMWNATAASDEHTESSVKPAHLGRLLTVKKFASGIASRGVAMASALTRNAMQFLGVPYVFGGTSSYGFDCSGFVQHVYASIGKHLPRTADAQYAVAHRIAGAPRAGDLVFFHTYEVGPSHVGISLGGDRFVHASSSHGVMVSSLHDSYWSARYLGAKRVVE